MPLGQQLDIGGVDADGNDASSDLSYMMLQATMNTRLNQPTVGVLWHRDMPVALAEKAVELTSLGTGHPSHYSSDAMVGMLKTVGLTEEEARQGCLIGCLEPQGRQGTTQPHVTGGWFTPATALELMLYNGVSPLTQQQDGPQSGDPRTFSIFEDVLEAVKSQLYTISKGIALQAKIARQVNHEFPMPFQSLLMPHCVETGMDLIKGGAEFNFPPAAVLVGIADYIDTLAAIKYLIYDEKKITMDQLIHALSSNFEDMDTVPSGPEIRQMCLAAPKYGNDDDYVDGISGKIMDIIPDAMDQAGADTGNPIRPGVTPMTGYMVEGLAVGALPSGRKAGKPLADGVSPKQGMDRQGPTAVVRSVTSWNHDRYSSGTQFNMKFSPATLKDRAGVKKFADLIRVFQESGGMHMQFNVVSADTLKDAQKDPENYPGLMVRVSGYSAQFADLDVDVQNDIISRSEHSL
jgi:formate C-acetyltransferase